MKKKILIILLLVLVFAIIFVTIIYITNRNNIKIEELYGTWTLEENKTILDGKETSNMVPWRCVIELQKNNNMKLCPIIVMIISSVAQQIIHMKAVS